MLPLGTSAATLGLGYIVALGRPPLNLLTSPLLIPIAHALLAFPFVVRSLLPALRGLDPRLREAARTLGAGPARVLREVDLPLLFPALLVGAVFAFTVSIGEFGAALLLYRPEYPTVPVVIDRFLGLPGQQNYGQALALSTILMLITGAELCAAGTGALSRYGGVLSLRQHGTLRFCTLLFSPRGGKRHTKAKNLMWTNANAVCYPNRREEMPHQSASADLRHQPRIHYG